MAMVVVERIIGNIKDIDATSLHKDPIKLYYDELNWTHRRLSSTRGTHVILSLPAGTHMRDGDILYKDDATVIYIDLISEKVVHIYPENNIQWAKVAYKIGSMQKELFLKNDGIYAISGTAIVRMLNELNVCYKTEDAKLEDEIDF